MNLTDRLKSKLHRAAVGAALATTLTACSTGTDLERDMQAIQAHQDDKPVKYGRNGVEQAFVGTTGAVLSYTETEQFGNKNLKRTVAMYGDKINGNVERIAVTYRNDEPQIRKLLAKIANAGNPQEAGIPTLNVSAQAQDDLLTRYNGHKTNIHAIHTFDKEKGHAVYWLTRTTECTGNEACYTAYPVASHLPMDPAFFGEASVEKAPARYKLGMHRIANK